MFENGLWFFLGAVVYALSSRVLNIGHGVYIFMELERAILGILLALDTDMAQAIRIKQRAYRESDLPEEIIKKMEALDEAVVKNWRDLVISKMILTSPKSFLRFYRYENWSQALEVLKRREKR